MATIFKNKKTIWRNKVYKIWEIFVLSIQNATACICCKLLDQMQATNASCCIHLLQAFGSSKHIYSCCTTNEELIQAVVRSTKYLIPKCRLCTLYKLNQKVRKLLRNKTQFSSGVRKKYLCDCLLRRQQRNPLGKILQPFVSGNDSTNTSNPIVLSSLVLELQKKCKRRKTDNEKDEDLSSKLKNITGEVSDTKAENLIW